MLGFFYLLFSNRITNQQFREFVGIESRHTALKILTKSGLEKVGDNKGRAYIITEDWIIRD